MNAEELEAAGQRQHDEYVRQLSDIVAENEQLRAWQKNAGVQLRKLLNDRNRLVGRLRAIRAAETGVKRWAFRRYALYVANLELPDAE